MQADKKLIALLQALLAEELTAIDQYVVHSEMYSNWGLKKLAEMERAKARDEMLHAEWIIERIVRYDSKPISKLLEVKIGDDIQGIIKNDLELERKAIIQYNTAIEVAVSESDNACRQLLEAILKSEDGHANSFEEQQDKIALMGLQVYLGSNQ